MYNDQIRIIPTVKIGLTFRFYRLKNKNHMIISLAAKNLKIPTAIHNKKNLSKLRMEGNSLKLTNNIFEKSIVNNILVVKH